MSAGKALCIISVFLYFVFSSSYGEVGTDDSLLNALDKAISQEKDFDYEKEQTISRLKSDLKRLTKPEDIHGTYYQLFKEYEAYVFDSALYYVQAHLKISELEQDAHWISECKMQLARMYSTFLRFYDAIDLLRSIDRSVLNAEQTGAYYNSYAEVYSYWGGYSSNDEILKYQSLHDTYQDSALMVLPKGTYGYDINHGRRCMDMGEFDEAESLLLPYLSQVEKSTRDYAILTSIIASLYELKGNPKLYKTYLTQSAIADIEGSVKENTSLGLLAYLLLNDGDINRSNRYIKKSMEDANFYNARLRNVQVSKILPIIDTAYQGEREKFQRKQQLAIWVIGILSLFLAGVIFYLFRQMKKLAVTRREVINANKELKKINNHLSETNQIKEEYIGRFLNQCSVYIDKLEAYRKSLNKKASARKMDELYEMLRSSQLVEDELKEFYQNFDSTFLNLFPDFVEQFNELLPKEERITPKYESGLTIELRIFALMRLGITDSAKIAGFLRYSITTIYNYRSKYRNKALVPREKFEEIVMKIGSKK